MKKVAVLVIVSLLLLSGCGIEYQPEYVPNGYEYVAEYGYDVVLFYDVEPFKDLIIRGREGIWHIFYIGGEWTNDVIGQIIHSTSHISPLQERIFDFGSVVEIREKLYFYSLEALQLEFRNSGHAIVGERIGFVPAIGENVYFVDPIRSTFEIISQDLSTVIVAVDVFGSVVDDIETHLYVFDVTSVSNPIIIDIRGVFMDDYRNSEIVPL